MTSDFEELQRVSALLGLAVKQAGGAIEITADEIREGFDGGGVSVILNDGGDITLKLLDADEAAAREVGPVEV